MPGELGAVSHCGKASCPRAVGVGRAGRLGGGDARFSRRHLPRRRLADDLRAAIDGGEVELRYQPQVAMADGRITGVEVLARWRHPRLGELGAERLFAAAARAGLLPALSQHIQAAALTEVGAWPAWLSESGCRAQRHRERSGAGGFRRRPARAARGARRRAVAADRRGDRARTDCRPAAAARCWRRCACRASGWRWTISAPAIRSSRVLKALPLDYLKLDGDLVRRPAGQRQAISRGRAMSLRWRGSWSWR